ncbi:hypothetical protein BGZ99_009016 [Dissophora globulifera]|uniref:Uncharacterized protein n=1 Tax=Dissophora globulifera TaxID=979702 RepID=A0A9P6UP00_9FUNG|nr:hypothetical protein BGZ99_009016 [Dissophora globulifera]
MEDSQPQCIEWIWSLLGECITTQQQAWSFLLGYVSIFCWLNAQIPQIIENFKLGSAALLTMKQALPVLQHDPSYSGFSSNGGSAPSPIARVFSRALAADQTLGEEPSLPDDQYIVHLGRIFAWVCTIFYLSSRMPQLWKNFQRKSVQGLSILMFFWAAMGNLSYTLSILNSADAVNPDTRTKFLREAVPYVLGSSGTLMFDLSIFGQWLYYTGKLYMIGIGPRPSHRRHRHRHHHSRQSRSRSRSRVESMALSPSGSQGGIYSVLVDEDDSEAVQDPLESLQEMEPSVHSAPLHQGQTAMDQTHISIGN